MHIDELDYDTTSIIISKLNQKTLLLYKIVSKKTLGTELIQILISKNKLIKWFYRNSLYSIDYNYYYRLLIDLINNKYRNDLLCLNAVTLKISRNLMTNIILSFIFTKNIIQNTDFSLLNKFSTIFDCFLQSTRNNLNFCWDNIIFDSSRLYYNKIQTISITKLKELVLVLCSNVTKRILYGVTLEVCWLGSTIKKNERLINI